MRQRDSVQVVAEGEDLNLERWRATRLQAPVRCARSVDETRGHAVARVHPSELVSLEASPTQ